MSNISFELFVQTGFSNWVPLVYQGPDDFKTAIRDLFPWTNRFAKIIPGMSSEVRIGWGITIPLLRENSEVLKGLAQAIEVDPEGPIKKCIKRIHNKAIKKERYFRGVGAISQERYNELDDQIVVIEAQTSSTALISSSEDARTKSEIQSENYTWALGDRMPGEKRFLEGTETKSFVLIKNEAGFPSQFNNQVPFCKELGWYPHVRITGVFHKPEQGDKYPQITMGYLELKPPKDYDDQKVLLGSLLKKPSETQKIRALLEDEDVPTAEQQFTYYLPNLLAWWKHMSPEQFSTDKELGSNLCDWYEIAKKHHYVHKALFSKLDPYYAAICAAAKEKVQVGES